VDRRFCCSKFFAVPMAASITRPEFISKNARGTVFCNNLAFDALDFNIYTVANLASIAGAGSQ
jgi:hypothetical protein